MMANEFKNKILILEENVKSLKIFKKIKKILFQKFSQDHIIHLFK
jgi:hypothetical protein